MKEVKCVVWDLDNTIWDGTLLEDNSVKIKEGIPDIIKTLDSRGILQSISSKNNYQEALEKLKEYGLHEYFLYPEINWNSKSLSIKRITENLNISLNSILFIDDQQFERDEVKYSLPEVFCFDSVDYKLLLEHPALNPKFITEDSLCRRKMYIEDINRKNDEEKFTGPKEEFLKSLKMELNLKRARESDLQRIKELTVRTHQLNTTGRTYDYDELKELISSDKHIVLTAGLKDIYGSYGKIGLVLIEKLTDEWRIKLFILSCRVMNRGIGTVLLNEMVKEAHEFSRKLSAEFYHTDKNRIMYITLKFANFVECDNSDINGTVILYNDLTRINHNPPYINLITEKEWI